MEKRDAGRSFSRPQRRIPEKQEEWLPWLNAIFLIRRNWDTMSLSSIFLPESLGKKFTYVIDQILTPLRVDIAHALSEASGELTLSVDELLHTQKVNRWLPLLKCTVRRMLKGEFPTEFLSYLKEDGTIIA